MVWILEHERDQIKTYKHTGTYEPKDFKIVRKNGEWSVVYEDESMFDDKLFEIEE